MSACFFLSEMFRDYHNIKLLFVFLFLRSLTFYKSIASKNHLKTGINNHKQKQKQLYEKNNSGLKNNQPKETLPTKQRFSERRDTNLLSFRLSVLQPCQTWTAARYQYNWMQTFFLDP